MTNFIQQVPLKKNPVYFLSVSTNTKIVKVKYALACINTQMTSY